MNIFLYLIGWCIILGTYGIFTAITIFYYTGILKYDLLLYVVKIGEFAILVLFGHQFLKRVTFKRMGIGKALIETVTLSMFFCRDIAENKSTSKGSL